MIKILIPYSSIILIEMNTWIRGHTLNNNTDLVLFNIILYHTYCTVLEDLLLIKLLTVRCYNGIRSTKPRLRLNVWHPKNTGHQMAAKSHLINLKLALNDVWPSQSGYRHFICADICHIGRDMTQNRIFGYGGTFCPRYPPITGFIMLFDHQNLGIDTSYVEISVISVKKMIQNIIFGDGGSFFPELPFSDNFDKDFLPKSLSLFCYQET